jgi:hypothetical protein
MHAILAHSPVSSKARQTAREGCAINSDRDTTIVAARLSPYPSKVSLCSLRKILLLEVHVEILLFSTCSCLQEYVKIRCLYEI